MNYDALYKPLLIKAFSAFRAGAVRSIGLFSCPWCGCEFEGRMDRLNIMTGLCAPCANIKAGRKRAKYEKGVCRSRLHDTWANMKRRCINPQGKEKDIYNGIVLCEEWMDFSSFKDWAMKNGYDDSLTIDRIDPSKGYNPDNCRFSDYSTQAANRRKAANNKSGYIGVCFQSGAWRSTVMWKRKQINIGRYSDPRDAAAARNRYIIDNNLPHTLNVV